LASLDASPLGRRCHQTNVQKAELEYMYTGALTAVTALTALQLASDDLAVVSAAGPTLRQRRQLALRAFINNSLLEGGDAREGRRRRDGPGPCFLSPWSTG
jgi:hypothetical protein